MGKKKWTSEQRQTQAGRWSPQMRQEAKYRALVDRHRDSIKKVIANPETRQKLVELARN